MNPLSQSERQDRVFISIGKGLIRRAEEDGRELDSFVAEWIRHCEAMNEHPSADPHILLTLADIDRGCGNKHDGKLLAFEREAFIQKRKRQGEHVRQGL